MSRAPKAERKLIAKRMKRMRHRMETGEWGEMSHAEAYKAVYGKHQPPAHKTQVLRNIELRRTGGRREPTRALDIDPPDQ